MNFVTNASHSGAFVFLAILFIRTRTTPAGCASARSTSVSAVAERACLVRERDDRQCDLLTARWGGTDRALAAVLDGVPPSALDVDWQFDRTVASFQTAVETLDYLQTEVLYHVGPTETTVFLPVWLGLPLADVTAAATTGGLVAVRSLSDVQRCRRAMRRLKGTFADALLAGSLPAPAAPFVLCGAIAGLSEREWYLSLLDDTSSESLYPGERPDSP